MQDADFLLHADEERVGLIRRKPKPRPARLWVSSILAIPEANVNVAASRVHGRLDVHPGQGGAAFKEDRTRPFRKKAVGFAGGLMENGRDG